jgi:hypothetical protein
MLNPALRRNWLLSSFNLECNNRLLAASWPALPPLFDQTVFSLDSERFLRLDFSRDIAPMCGGFHGLGGHGSRASWVSPSDGTPGQEVIHWNLKEAA